MRAACCGTVCVHVCAVCTLWDFAFHFIRNLSAKTCPLTSRAPAVCSVRAGAGPGSPCWWGEVGGRCACSAPPPSCFSPLS